MPGVKAGAARGVPETDLDLARRVGLREPAAVRRMTEANNQRLYRAAWAILKNRAEAEEAVQAAYLKAFAGIGGFLGASSLSTWLTRILVNEALERRRKAVRERQAMSEGVTMMEDYRDRLARGSGVESPETRMARQQLRQILEEAVARLPEDFRLAFVLGDIEGMSLEETAAALGVPSATVKTRRLRARRRLREDLGPQVRDALTGAFPFAGVDCEALTARVLEQLCPAPTRVREP